jgi:tRNA pseudouridine55 synthase
MNFHFQEGEVVLIDKELDWTSFDVVRSIRNSLVKELGLKKIKVGHAGTLDPLASGLLLLCTGKATKNIDQLQAQEKVYSGTFVLGATTPSYDLETEINQTYPTSHIDSEKLEECVASFIGVQQQFPPKYSAIKVNGKRAYEYARADKELELKSREITIYNFTMDAQRFPEIDFEIRCSKGTYIRSIARDFGLKLQSGAYLSVLRREKIGDYTVKDALKVSQFKALINELKSSQS